MKQTIISTLLVNTDKEVSCSRLTGQSLAYLIKVLEYRPARLIVCNPLMQSKTVTKTMDVQEIICRQKWETKLNLIVKDIK